MAQPLSVPPSLYWDGNDGNWSTFWLRAGTPPQPFRLLPATSQNALWPVISWGCEDPRAELDCVDKRGGVFHQNASDSWRGIANFSSPLETETLLGYHLSALYGNDTITFGLTGDSYPSLQDQSVQAFEQLTFWNGFIGLSSKVVVIQNLSTFQPSILQSLMNQNAIPSLSWSYTAGAFYLNPPVYGSLTLGGYDASRIDAKNITIPFGTDNVSRDLTAVVQSIGIGSGRFLSTTPISALIDSVVPHIWLPLEVCEQFEQQLNITWNSNYQLYTLTDEQHSNLLSISPTFTFTIASSLDNTASTVDIEIPYSAFDLVGNPPWLPNATRYFPLRRAASWDQYTLGRAFLQGATVVTNYETQNFQIAQALFPTNGTGANIVPISHGSAVKAPESPQPSPPKSQHSAGFVVGIVVGPIAAVALLSLAVWVLLRNLRISDKRHDSQSQGLNTESAQQTSQSPESIREHEATNGSTFHELEGKRVIELDASEVTQLDSSNVVELCAHPERM